MSPQELQAYINSGRDAGLLAAIKQDAQNPFTPGRYTNAYLKAHPNLIADGYHINQAGQVVQDEGLSGIWKPLAIGGGALLTAGLLAPALGGGAAAAGAGTGGSVAGTAAGTGGAVAGTAAAVGGTSLLDRILAPVISAGAGLAGAAMQSSANNRATDAQAKAAEDALNFEKQLYAQQRADLANYRAAGQGAIGQLSYAFGVPGFENGPMAPQTTYNLANPTTSGNPALANSPYSNGAVIGPNASQTQLMNPSTLPPYAGTNTSGSNSNNTGPGTTLSAIHAPTAPTAQSSTADLVTVRAPTGEVRQIPASQLGRALGLGAVQV